MDLGTRIKAVASERDVSLNSVAKQTGLTRSYVAALANSRIKDPRISTLLKIARALGVHPGELLEGVEFD